MNQPLPFVSWMVLGLLATRLASAAPSSTAAVDFGTFIPPENGKTYVEVNVPSHLLNLAARLAEKAEPEAAKLLRGLQSVRVHVIGLDDSNQTELTERVRKLSADLDAKGWLRVVTVREKTQEVGVYVKHRGDEAIEGVVVTVLSGSKEAVLVHVAGDITPEQLAALGERLNIEPLRQVGNAIPKS